MKATAEDRARLEAEIESLVSQLKKLGAVKVILFGSLGRGEVSLFTDIDLLVLFEREGSPRDLTRWVYQNIDAREGVDILAHTPTSLERLRRRPFFKKLLSEGRVLYERPES